MQRDAPSGAAFETFRENSLSLCPQLAERNCVPYPVTMNADDNDKLWELLGNNRQPGVSPFFSRNILRAVRREEGEQRALSGPGSFLSGLARGLHRWSWKLTIAGTCAIVAVVTVSPSAFRHHHAMTVKSGVASQIVGNPDYEVITHLDELVADEESSLWLDDSVH
jgi:hypothetical protein